VATARNPEQLVELRSRYGENIRTVPLDVTSEAQAKAAFEAAIGNFGDLDVVVNNAGYGYVCPVEDTSLADFRAQVETNLFGVIIMTKAVLPYFRERRAGHIIQVTSIAGRIGPAGRAPYAAAKFGVEGFSESLSKEIGPLGVKVTILEPGGFRTDFAGPSTVLREGHSEYDSTVGASVRFQRSYNGKQPGDPAKAAACFCTSPRSPIRRCGCCSEAIVTQLPRRVLLRRLRQTGGGRTSASRRTTRRTTPMPKNPANSSRLAGYRVLVFIHTAGQLSDPRAWHAERERNRPTETRQSEA
jgi:NAD(P)-dependent dehydrogenase (short-subunit alcohol dehydrogenase family)